MPRASYGSRAADSPNLRPIRLPTPLDSRPAFRQRNLALRYPSHPTTLRNPFRPIPSLLDYPLHLPCLPARSRPLRSTRQPRLNCAASRPTHRCDATLAGRHFGAIRGFPVPSHPTARRRSGYAAAPPTTPLRRYATRMTTHPFATFPAPVRLPTPARPGHTLHDPDPTDHASRRGSRQRSPADPTDRLAVPQPAPTDSPSYPCSSLRAATSLPRSSPFPRHPLDDPTRLPATRSTARLNADPSDPTSGDFASHRNPTAARATARLQLRRLTTRATTPCKPLRRCPTPADIPVRRLRSPSDNPRPRTPHPSTWRLRLIAAQRIPTSGRLHVPPPRDASRRCRLRTPPPRRCRPARPARLPPVTAACRPPTPPTPPRHSPLRRPTSSGDNAAPVPARPADYALLSCNQRDPADYPPRPRIRPHPADYPSRRATPLPAVRRPSTPPPAPRRRSPRRRPIATRLQAQRDPADNPARGPSRPSPPHATTPACPPQRLRNPADYAAPFSRLPRPGDNPTCRVATHPDRRPPPRLAGDYPSTPSTSQHRRLACPTLAQPDARRRPVAPLPVPARRLPTDRNPPPPARRPISRPAPPDPRRPRPPPQPGAARSRRLHNASPRDPSQPDATDYAPRHNPAAPRPDLTAPPSPRSAQPR